MMLLKSVDFHALPGQERYEYNNASKLQPTFFYISDKEF